MRKLLVATVFMLLALPALADWDRETFDAGIAETHDIDAAIALCREAASSSRDIDLLRRIVDRWKPLDSEGCRDFFAARQVEDPRDAVTACLLGHSMEIPLARMIWGRRAVRLDPELKQGYQLLASVYAEHVIGAAEPVPELVTAFVDDKDIFERLVAVDPADGNAQQMLMAYRLHEGDLDGARALFETAKADSARWATGLELARIEAHAGDLAAVQRLIGEEMDAYVAAGQMDAAEHDAYGDYIVDRTLRGAEAYELLLEAQRARSVAEDEAADASYNIACTLALLDRDEEALVALQDAVAAGYDDADHMREDEDLLGLQEDPAWAAILSDAEAALSAGADARRTEVLTAGFEREAPDWTLRAADGSQVALADLRGEVLILDFWATWCSPCRMAMPVIDAWIKDGMPEGVRVFSVNVWEQTPAWAHAFLIENEYAMELLYGDAELAKAYGVRGIPYICAIDREGKVRFEEKGYSSELGENLAIWAEALTQ